MHICGICGKGGKSIHYISFISFACLYIVWKSFSHFPPFISYTNQGTTQERKHQKLYQICALPNLFCNDMHDDDDGNI